MVGGAHGERVVTEAISGRLVVVRDFAGAATLAAQEFSGAVAASGPAATALPFVADTGWRATSR